MALASIDYRPSYYSPVLRTWRRRWPWLAGLALVVAWVGGCALLVLSARSDLLDGVRRVEAARGAGAGVGSLQGETLPGLRQAQASFQRAHRKVASPVVAPATFVPVAGRQLRSVRALSGSAERVVGVAIEAAGAASAELERPEQTGRGRVELVVGLSRIAGDSARKLEAVDLGPSESLVAPVADARQRFAKELEGARSGLAKLSVASESLATFLTGPRRYLVFAANNAEMRAGAGMPLTYGVLEVRDGALNMASMDSVGTLPRPRPGVPVDPDMAKTWEQFKPNEAWVNVNMTPRFPASAELAARMWAAIGRGPVDGVLLVDPVALKVVLASTGPVMVPGGTVSADSVVGDALHDQYRDTRTPAGDLRRRDRLSDIGVATIRAANDRVDVSRLGQDLYDAVQGRHLLAWSNRPEDQRAWDTMGAGGTLSSDSVMVSVLNRGGSKLDQFLNVEASLESAGAETTMTLRLANRTPPGEPPYVLGFHRFLGLPPGAYAGIATVHLPEGTEMADPGAFVPRGRDGPTAVLVAPVQVRPGDTRELVARFRLPPRRRAVWVEPSARLPAVTWRVGAQTWSDERGRTASLSASTAPVDR